MKRVFLAIAACALATSAVAADQKPDKELDAPKKGSEPSPKAAVLTAKQALKAAVELCDAPGRCEPGSRSLNREYLTMLQDSEKRFVEACQRCASAERCEAERLRMREGKRSLGAAPCR